MKRQDLEIILSQKIKNIPNPKIELEQYSTSSRVAANLVYWAYMFGDIDGKNVIDVCSGTGILGIAAALLGAKVTFLEIDKSIEEILTENLNQFNIDAEVIFSDLFEWESKQKFHTSIINPPFGIKQKKRKDLDFIKKSVSIAKITYSILDGTPSNLNNVPSILEKDNIQILANYKDQFLIKNIYPWHKKPHKIQDIVVYRLSTFKN